MKTTEKETMTTTEHLQKIKAECERLLAIAKKRTKGEWSMFNKSRTLTIDIGNEPHGRLPSIINWPGFDSNNLPYNKNVANAAFIVACAGTAEAGWRSTIAAIEVVITSGFLASPLVKEILAAWPTELLQ